MSSRTREERRLGAVPARPRQLLDRILSVPDLVVSVQALAPAALGRLIRHVGLEDAGELVSLATTEQLAAIFDDDLWTSSRPGVDESFDGARFALWLEVMIEAGEAFAARRLTELDEDLVALAFARQVLVIDMDELVGELAGYGPDEEVSALEKALDSCPYQELGQYRVIARRHEGWDAIVSVLVALDEQHHEFLVRLLERLAHVSSDWIEESGGLYQVLSAAQTLEEDAAGEREERRGREGYVAPSAAASFLALARTQPGDGSGGEDPVTRAYFRAYQPRPRAAAGRPAPAGADLVALLRDAGVLEAREAVPQLESGRDADEPDRFRDALVALGERDGELHERRMVELSYLANVLIAGCRLAGRRFRPFEAAAAAVATCNLGLERLSREEPQRDAIDLVIRFSAVALFRAGWRALDDEVAAPARSARAASLAPEAATALAGLAGECPCLTGALAEIAAPGAARPRVFIASHAHIRAAREFLRGL